MVIDDSDTVRSKYVVVLNPGEKEGDYYRADKGRVLL